MITPLINKPRKQGGTLYTFSSASRDLTKVFTNNDYSFKFSNFACLNIPDIKKTVGEMFGPDGSDSDSDPDYIDGSKGLCLQNLHWTSETLTGDVLNKVFAEHIQNYIMNFEVAILNGEGDNDNYDNDILRSPAERIFWNWMTKVNGITFKDDDLFSYENCSFDERTVPYIGTIDVINSVEINGDAYDEVYIHIPSNVGASSKVLFKRILDNNYGKAMLNDATDFGSSVKYKVEQSNLGESSVFSDEYIIGRVKKDDLSKTESDYGLSLEAIYDDDANDSYTGDNGYCISFQDTDYSCKDYNNISQMNSLSSANFEFNAVLIYYDLSRTENGVTKTVTNLYGILILEEITDAAANDLVNRAGYIQRYPKYKEDEFAGNGNSFGLKVDIKIDTMPDSSGVSTVYRDANEPVAMNLYQNVLTKMQDCVDIFHTQQIEVGKIQERLTELENLLFGIDEVSEIRNTINDIIYRLDSNAVVDTGTLLELIEEINQRMIDLVNGKVSVELQYNTDVLKRGYGIDIVKQNDGIYIGSNITSYSLNDLTTDKDFNESITPDNPLYIANFNTPSKKNVCYTNLLEGTNLAILYVDGTETSNNIEVYIKDTDTHWKAGQSFQLMIRDNIDFGENFSLLLFTGFDDEDYKHVIKIEGFDVPYRPIIEIICVDDTVQSSGTKFIYEIKSLDSAGTSSGSKDDLTVVTEESLSKKEISFSTIDDIVKDVFGK